MLSAATPALTGGQRMSIPVGSEACTTAHSVLPSQATRPVARPGIGWAITSSGWLALPAFLADPSH